MTRFTARTRRGLRADIAALTELLDERTAENADLRIRLRNTAQQVIDRGDEKHELERKLAALDADHAEQARQIKTLRDERDQAQARVRDLEAEVAALREMITAKPTGIVRIEGDLTPEAAAAVKMTRLPDDCRCTWTLMLPEGEFRRDAPNPSCTADHGEPAPAQPATDSAQTAPAGRKARGAGPRTGKSAAGHTEPSGGTEAEGFAE